MAKAKKNGERERRITEGILVDAYGPEEQAMECQHEMFVEIRWERKRSLAIPLSQVKATGEADEDTREAVADWHYWIGQGYML